MNELAKRPQNAAPVNGSVRWLMPWADVRPALESGRPVPLTITVETRDGLVTHGYIVRQLRDGDRVTGYELERADCDTRYHLDTSFGGLAHMTCDCPDATWRERHTGCKHRRGLLAALAKAGVE